MAVTDHSSPVAQEPSGFEVAVRARSWDWLLELRRRLKVDIQLVDDRLGRVLDALEQTGQRDNTLIVFTSDHGETMGDHGLTHKGCRFYEGLAHVPLIFSWPARFAKVDRIEMS
jgi:membrane-anchored protein YejM (alkaline phosphatase superfamily)